jgi:hypothetical protein
MRQAAPSLAVATDRIKRLARDSRLRDEFESSWVGHRVTIIARGLLLIVVPRGTQQLRLKEAIAHGSDVPATQRVGFLRRVAWWKLTWTLDTPISAADSQRFVSDLMGYMKEARQWPSSTRQQHAGLS